MNTKRSWRGILDWLIIGMVIGCALLSSIAFFHKPKAGESKPAYVINGVSLNRYGVAGGGEQYVVTFSGEDATQYEVVITKVVPE